MDIKLNQAYSSMWDNIQYPIYKLADNSYLCITYSCNHRTYNLNIYTEEEFKEQGFKEDDYNNYLFKDLTSDIFENSVLG